MLREPCFLDQAFDAEPRVRPGLIALFLLINAIVFWNAVRHPPDVGYDARGHLRYIRFLSEGSLPTAEETREYFSPPLPYVIPAAARVLGLRTLAAAKVGQFVNVALSLGLTLLLLRFCQRLRPGDAALKLLALGLLGSMAVYPKTFCQVRGEPWVAFLGMAIAGEVVRAASERHFTVRRSVVLGVLCGLILLARQWGALVLLGCALFALLFVLRRPALRPLLVRTLGIALAVAFLVAAWFYLGLQARYGSILAFSGNHQSFSLANQPRDFYFGTGNGQLFRRPVRPAFPNQVIPTFYAETWGDYCCYFLISGRNVNNGRRLQGRHLQAALARRRTASIETNLPEKAAYLGRVNRVALLPTSVLLGGFLLGGWLLALLAARRADPTSIDLGIALAFAIVVVSLAGYFWFLVAHPSPNKGDTIKATYLLHIFPFLTLMGAETLIRLRDRSPGAFRAVAVLLALVALYNAPTLFTTY